MSEAYGPSSCPSGFVPKNTLSAQATSPVRFGSQTQTSRVEKTKKMLLHGYQFRAQPVFIVFAFWQGEIPTGLMVGLQAFIWVLAHKEKQADATSET